MRWCTVGRAGRLTACYTLKGDPRGSQAITGGVSNNLASACRLASAALALMVLAGCATSSATKQAFGASKRFAIVSIYASPTIANSSGNQMGGSVLGMVKAASKDSGYRTMQTRCSPKPRR